MTDGVDPVGATLQFVQRVKIGLAEEAGLAARAAQQLSRMRADLVELITARAERNWTSEEFERYLVLSRSERTCELTYAMARRRFDGLRRRLISLDDAGPSNVNQ